MHRLIPRRFSHQVALVVSLLFALTVVLYTAHTVREQSATGEQMLLHVDMAAGRAAPMPEWLLEHVQAIHAAHAVLPKPKQAGAAIGIRRKTV